MSPRIAQRVAPPEVELDERALGRAVRGVQAGRQARVLRGTGRRTGLSGYQLLIAPDGAP